MIQENSHDVQVFYNSAVHAYKGIMGYYWHHGEPEAVASGLSRDRCCEIAEERLVALADIRPGDKVLDFGSGVGGPTLHMAKVSGASFIGVTNNDGLTRIAKAKAAEMGMSEQVIFQTVDDNAYKRFPYPDASFDAIVTIEAVCHLTDKAAFFREVGRLLKPGGRFTSQDWVQRPFGEYQTEEQIMNFMRPVNQTIFLSWHGTIDGYRKMLEDAGLKVYVSRDMFPGLKCWIPAMDDQASAWANYDGPERERFRQGERVLDAARRAGVFTIGTWVAQKPK